MSFTVFLMPEAVSDLDEALTFYRSRSADGAARWLASFEAAICSLERDPERFAVAPEAARFRKPIREATFGSRPTRPTHRLLFVIARQRVQVVKILHHAQRDWIG